MVLVWVAYLFLSFPGGLLHRDPGWVPLVASLQHSGHSLNVTSSEKKMIALLLKLDNWSSLKRKSKAKDKYKMTSNL